MVDCDKIPKLKTIPGICAYPTCENKLTGRRRKWCSNKCSRKYQDQIWNNHDWNSARKAALKRDNHKCVKCGSTEKLEVNHINPRNGAGYGFSCGHHLDNLEVLCHTCHVKVTNEQRKARKGR